MNIRGIIWGTSFARARRILDDMEVRYNNCGYKTITKKRDWINFENGDLWRVIGNAVGTRGQRCNIAYIDSQIPSDIVHECIMPCCCLPPFSAIHYYDYDIETFDGED